MNLVWYWFNLQRPVIKIDCKLDSSIDITAFTKLFPEFEVYKYDLQTRIVFNFPALGPLLEVKKRRVVQGPSTQIDAFQVNIFSWLDDIIIKTKIFLKSSDREIWYKTFNLVIHVVLWSQSLHIWKIQWVVLLIFCSHIHMKVKTKTM